MKQPDSMLRRRIQFSLEAAFSRLRKSYSPHSLKIYCILIESGANHSSMLIISVILPDEAETGRLPGLVNHQYSRRQVSVGL